MGWTTRMVAAGAVTAAVVTSVALGGVGAEKPEAVPGPVSIPAGYVAFEIGPDGTPQIARYDENDVPVQQIDLDVSNKCLVRNRPQLAALLDIRALGPTNIDVHYVDSGLGFRKTGNCSRGNGRVSAGQTLALKAGPGLSFISAELNIEGKFDADLTYTIDGAAPVVAPLQSDTGDNGPDSGDGDNTIVVIEPDNSFTTIALSPTSADGRGQIALDNGGDSADRAANRTIFRLGRTFDYTVDCGDNRVVSESGTEADSVDGVTFIRSDNKEGVCKPIGVDIDIEVGGVTEGGDLRDVIVIDASATSIDGTPQQVRARVKLEWRVQRYEGGGALRSPEDINLELERQIEYPDSAPQLLTYCASSEIDGDPMNTPAADPGRVIHPDDQPWCLLSDTRVLDGDEIIQVMILDVGGDPKFF